MRRISWSGRDKDRHFGPFTLSTEKSPWGLGIVLDSGDEEVGAYARMHLTNRLTVLFPIPQRLLRPHKVFREFDPRWAPETGERGYTQIYSRAYGVVFCGTSLHVYRGPQTWDSDTTKVKVWIYPWSEFRTAGQRALFPETRYGRVQEVSKSSISYEAASRLYHAVFEFRDYDGETLRASCLLLETLQRRGRGRFWDTVMNLRGGEVKRGLRIRFSGEVGEKKGSWKGGVIGLHLTMEPGESINEAFKRLCRQKNLKYIGRLPNQIGEWTDPGA